ncbi:MAG: septal ring lytic transglycosylase RlpA family protein [Hyphomicrobium sp.]|jgi:rare lipoprotein A
MQHPIIAGTCAAVLILGAAVLICGAAVAKDCGKASYYGTESGSRTANGEPFDGSTMTAAHRTLPFGTRLRVSYRGTSVVVRINDRGPFVRGRVLDLSQAAAKRLGMIPAGVGTVCMERLQ